MRALTAVRESSMDELVAKLNDIQLTFEELEQKLSDPEVVSNSDHLKRLSRTRKQLLPTVEAYAKWKELNKQIEGAQDILRTETDKELR